VFIIMRHSRRTFVEKVDFITSMGHGQGGDHRKRLGLPGAGPTHIVTDLCVLAPDKNSELVVIQLHEGVTRRQVQQATGWDVRFSPSLETYLKQLPKSCARSAILIGVQAGTRDPCKRLGNKVIMPSAFICDAIRTLIGRYGEALSSVRPDDMAAHVLRTLMERNPSADRSTLEEVFLGCANQSGEDNRNVARMASVLAGMSPDIPGVTFNRL
jgi:hypothetical protein